MIFDKSFEPAGDHKDGPWWAAEAVAFIETVLTKEMSVLEFGSGTSTSWFAERVREVVSIEHHKWWYEALQGLRPNVTVVFKPLALGRYAEAAIDLGREWDVVAVDGMWRPECIEYSIHYLSRGGYLILDDAQRAAYAGIITALKAAGYYSIGFGRADHQTAVFSLERF